VKALKEAIKVRPVPRFFERETTLIFLFYAIPDGKASHFSWNCFEGRQMTDMERRGRATEAFFGRRKGKALRGQQAEKLSTLLPAFIIDLSAAPPEPLKDLFPVRPIACGWRSASAAASI
jgi:hypothetical protein